MKTAHLAAGEVHRARMRSRERFVLALGIEPDDQLLADVVAVRYH